MVVELLGRPRRLGSMPTALRGPVAAAAALVICLAQEQPSVSWQMVWDQWLQDLERAEDPWLKPLACAAASRIPG